MKDLLTDADKNQWSQSYSEEDGSDQDICSGQKKTTCQGQRYIGLLKERGKEEDQRRPGGEQQKKN